jgi:hypothetical protein
MDCVPQLVASHHHAVVAAAHIGLSCSLKTAAERSADRNQDAGSNEASNQVADPTGERAPNSSSDCMPSWIAGQSQYGANDRVS